MKYTASEKYNITAKSAAKDLITNVYARITTSLSESISLTNWTDVTDYIPNETLSTFASSLEYEYGQYTSDNSSITGLDINYWKNNFFTDDVIASKYVEIKVTSTLKQGEYTATEVPIVFSGFVDFISTTPQYNEVDDSVSFSVNTADYIGSTLNAEELLYTRYIMPNINKQGMTGLQLFNIPGIYVTSSNIAGYPLTEGIHTIKYTFQSGSDGAYHILKLDEKGINNVLDTNVSGSTIVFGENYNEMVGIYFNKTLLPKFSSSADLESTIVVKNEGDALPYTWYHYVGARNILIKCFNAIGLTTQTFDTMEIPTYDGRDDYSYLDAPPDSKFEQGEPTALVVVNEETMYVGVGGVVYKRNNTTQTYEVIVNESTEISRLLYDAGNQYLWIFTSKGPSTHGKFRVYDIAHDTLSSLYDTAKMIYPHSIAVDSNRQAIIFRESVTGQYINLEYTDESFDQTTITGISGYSRGQALIVIGNVLYYPAYNADNDVWVMLAVTHDGSTWGGIHLDDYIEYNTMTITSDPAFVTYNTAESAFYYLSDDAHIYKLTALSDTQCTGYSLVGLQDVIATAYDKSKGQSIFSCKDWSTAKSFYFFLKDGVAEKSGEDHMYWSSVANYYVYTTDSSDSKLYGINIDKRLFQYDDNLAMYINELDVKDKSIKDVINDVCKAFNLVYTVNANKEVYIYKRSDNTGTTITSGDSVIVTSNEVSSINCTVNKYPKYDYVVVKNDTDKSTYNGTDFDEKELIRYKVCTLNNNYIPSYMLKDINYYLFKFLNVNRNMYQIELGAIPLFQYEPFDSCTFIITNGRITPTTKTGVIYGALYDISDGTTILDVLI